MKSKNLRAFMAKKKDLSDPVPSSVAILNNDEIAYLVGGTGFNCTMNSCGKFTGCPQLSCYTFCGPNSQS
jgi:hypothetical protein